MTEKGQVSLIDTTNRMARIVIKRLDQLVTANIPYAPHVNIQVNDFVAVVFFSNNLTDGLIISAFN